MSKERSGEGARVYGRSEDTAGKEIKVQAPLSAGGSAKTWLIINGPTLGLDVPGARRLIAALGAFVEEAEEAESAPEEIELPEPARGRFVELLERSVAVADEWRAYAATLPDGPVKVRSLNLAAAVYVERALSAPA